MSQPQPPLSAATPRKGGWLKAGILGVLGLGSGVVGTYATAVVDRIARPPLPVANFAATASGLTVTCQNHATGESGWWDFGDGSPLEPFDPKQTEVKHEYAKPGSYSVKLTVRNFVADENDRTVQVSVAATGADSPVAPQIAAFTVQPVSPLSVAPATFRVTADVKDADHAVWDFGDGRLEVADGSGRIERLVTFEKPGSFGVQLVAHNGKQAAKQAAAVKVEPPVAGTLMAVLRVTDTGTRVERLTRSETVAVQAPKEKAPPAFTRTIAARSGFTLAEAAPTSPNTARSKNLKVAISPDKRSATVSGEWAGDPKGGKGAGSDLLIPVKLTEERATPVQSPPETITGAFLQHPGGQIMTALPLPSRPANVAGLQRKMSLEVRQATGDGRFRTVVTVADMKFPWSGQLDMGPSAGGQRVLQPVRAAQEGETVKLTIGN
jgi:hypothetical protein